MVFIDTLIKMLTAIVVVAIIAVLLSKKSTTAQALSSAGSAFNAIVKQVVSPITAV